MLKVDEQLTMEFEDACETKIKIEKEPKSGLDFEDEKKAKITKRTARCNPIQNIVWRKFQASQTMFMCHLVKNSLGDFYFSARRKKKFVKLKCLDIDFIVL